LFFSLETFSGDHVARRGLEKHFFELSNIMHVGTSDLLMGDRAADPTLVLEKRHVLNNLHVMFHLEVSFTVLLETHVVNLVDEVFEGKLINGAEDHRSCCVVIMVFADELVKAENGVLVKFFQLCLGFVYFYIDLSHKRTMPSVMMYIKFLLCF